MGVMRADTETEEGFTRRADFLSVGVRRTSGMGGTGGVSGTVSKRRNDSLDAANELLE